MAATPRATSSSAGRRRSAASVPVVRRWFGVDDAQAVADFWRAYEDAIDAIEPAERDGRRAREVLSEAVRTGDFGPYEDLLAKRARRDLRRGEDVLDLEVLGRIRLLVPRLVRAHGDDPERLMAALAVSGQFAARSSAVVTRAAQESYEAALRRSERSLATTLESLGDGLVATDASGRIERMNRVAQEYTGWTLDEAKGRRLDEVFRVVDEDTGAVVPSGIHDVLHDLDAPTLPWHPSLLGPDGSARPIAHTVAPIRDDQGVVRGAVVVFRDLTREREHERALTASQRQLRSLAESVENSREEERTRIARELHDELAQQLTALWMDLGWMGPRLECLAPEVRERVEAMSAMVDSMFTVVRRIGTRLRPIVLDDLGLSDAIEWQAVEFERRSGIKIDMDVSDELGELDRARSTALFRMFQELLTNVARHAKARRVAGRLAVEGDEVLLEVADDGRGIREEQITNPRSLGLLGLRERASLHGGSFEIRRARPRGTVATVRIPRRVREQR